MKKIKVTKPVLLKKGKKVFGSMSNFNMWLNTDNEALGCRPVTLWENKKGLENIYNELVKIEVQC